MPVPGLCMCKTGGEEAVPRVHPQGSEISARGRQHRKAGVPLDSLGRWFPMLSIIAHCDLVCTEHTYTNETTVS